MIEPPSPYEVLICVRCKSTVMVWKGGMHRGVDWKRMKRERDEWIGRHWINNCLEIKATAEIKK